MSERRACAPCIACGRELREVFADAPNNQPDGALAFASRGAYGTTFFDPMRDDLRIEVNVCDPCLVARHDRVVLVAVGATHNVTRRVSAEEVATGTLRAPEEDR